MKFTTILTIFGLFALGVVGTAALANRAQIESERIQECRQALKIGGYEKVHVRFRSQECIVTGSVPSEPDKAAIVEMLRAMDGVQEMNSSGLLVGAP